MSSSLSKCARCGKPATLQCDSCANAPAYCDADSTITFYCNLECQKLHRSKDALKCDLLRDRKKLERAAGILQEIIYKILEHASPLRFESVEVRGSDVFMHGFEVHYEGRSLDRFPVDANDPTIPIRALLVNNSCMEAMIYLNDFALEVLRGVFALFHISSSWRYTNPSKSCC